MARPIGNAEIAAILDRVADLLQAQDASTWRVRAYRIGAETCRTAPRPLAEIAAEKDAAENRDERRKALDWCLEEKWASKDIGCIERVDTATKHGWKMSPYRV